MIYVVEDGFEEAKLHLEEVVLKKNNSKALIEAADSLYLHKLQRKSGTKALEIENEEIKNSDERTVIESV
jgi:hypothetical protein